MNQIDYSQDRDEFLALATGVLTKNPSWLAETFKAANQAVMDRLAQEQAKRADAETAVVILTGIDSNFESVAKEQKPIIARVIVNSKMFGGSPYALKLAKKYQIIDPHAKNV